MSMFIEFSFDMFTYVSLLSVFVVAMTCYVTRQANHVIFVERFVAYDENGCAKKPSDAYRHILFHTRFIMFQQRKIPTNERSHASDEEGRLLLVC
ncbi:hypothetical protein HNR43_002070 [Anoxybacillus mongoliensis]|uniref:Uncharacterized protein n=1 Tax=Anoxybacillus mongoliensis TaxID=452565 RepID=A0A7W8JFK8_9BACL|nr:hypothetical protein [Anoxybacillus mongoliensis]MBB5356090.1 hypothetical protein [Anoxybacillus mongoliensis]